MKVHEIALTEKQKSALMNLNDKKVKIEKEHDAVQEELTKLLDFIFDSKNFDVNTAQQIGFNGNAIVFTEKEEIIVPEVLPAQ